ncbi:mandelate racemase/muconate lactonizing enzyme family protein [Ancylobacter mangrovi]|uniref:Mandelate racemase/muconate lactonizing enzyme family protein n=1 Tax=Ancylobacter mangrovi TaxID=2972472 RepID=A0A9X2PCB1_9HYPH|nr:mandelate racemase/muconate lactonizing enzyme family protein [Ancylobacter mangrovi]MCS0494794.1 mandelate racemase/muconate lactonizing enzyme family protein [Ancylobacter mangrovi]MCS0502185.1 mandelate racemase/muconate lactonizing enzyme family protein [Ancylobacter mangrovi]
MKITAVETYLVSAPLDVIWNTGIGSGTRRDELLVVVRTDENVYGLGSSYHAHAPLAVKALIDEKLAPMAIGEDALDIQGVWEKLHYGSVYLGAAAVSALSGIDIALWDILGKVTGQPIARLLGGGGVDRVVAYIGCMVLGHKPMEDLLAEAKSYADMGFKALKVRGGAGVERDIEVVRETRKLLGPGVDVMIDMNASYSWPEAVRVARGLGEVGAFWMEDPFDYTVANHHDDVGRLTKMALVPIASGGNVYTRYDVRNLFERGGVDFITPDAVKCGGISEAMKVAHLASAANVLVAPHTLNGLGQVANVHFAAAIPSHVRAHVEWDPGSNNPLRDDMLTNPIKVVDGFLKVPTGPGLGTDLKWDVVRQLPFSTGEEIKGHGKRRSRRWNQSAAAPAPSKAAEPVNA